MGKAKSKYNFKPDKIYLIVGIVALCIGIAVIVGMSVYSGRNLAKIQKYTQTTATVVDYKVSYIDTTRHGYGHSKTEVYAEIAEFEVDGTTYTVTNQISASSGVKQIGDSVQIAYNPDDPNDCIFITSNNDQGIIVIFVLGFIFAIVGSFLLYSYSSKYRKWKKSNNEICA